MFFRRRATGHDRVGFPGWLRRRQEPGGHPPAGGVLPAIRRLVRDAHGEGAPCALRLHQGIDVAQQQDVPLLDSSSCSFGVGELGVPLFVAYSQRGCEKVQISCEIDASDLKTQACFRSMEILRGVNMYRPAASQTTIGVRIVLRCITHLWTIILVCGMLCALLCPGYRGGQAGRCRGAEDRGDGSEAVR